MFDVEKLEAGRETDAMVSEKVLGLQVCRCQICVDTGPNGMCENCERPRGKFYSTHPEKALGLLEHLAKTQQATYRIERTPDDRGNARFEVTLAGAKKARGAGATLPLAICRAVIAAVEAT